MRIELEFYGPLQDRIGLARASFDVADPSCSTTALTAEVARHFEGGDALLNPHVRLAVNDAFVASGTELSVKAGDRVAFLAPFSGG